MADFVPGVFSGGVKPVVGTVQLGGRVLVATGRLAIRARAKTARLAGAFARASVAQLAGVYKGVREAVGKGVWAVRAFLARMYRSAPKSRVIVTGSVENPQAAAEFSRDFGEIITGNRQATIAYRQLQRQGINVELDFVNAPVTSNGGRVGGEFYRYQNRVVIYVKNQESAQSAVGTLVHESQHARDLLNYAHLEQPGMISHPLLDSFDGEFRAFRAQRIYLQNRALTEAEVAEIVENIRTQYPELYNTRLNPRYPHGN